MLAKRWSWCLFFLIFFCGHHVYAAEPTLILDGTLQLNRWGIGRKAFSFSANEQCGQLSVEADEAAPRIWMLYIRLNGRHLVLRFPGRKSLLIFSRQVELKTENHIRLVVVGRPRARLSIRIQPCAPSPPPPTAKLSATPDTTNHPDDCDNGFVAEDRCSATLSWSATDADECRIEPDVGEVDCSGNIAVSPQVSTTYTLTANGDGGSADASAEIVVVHFPQAELTLADTQVLKGESTTLKWTTTHADKVEIQPEIGTVNSEGVVTVHPEASTTYTLTATGPGGMVSRQAALTVLQPQMPPTVRLLPTEVSISQGDSVTLSWKTTSAEKAFFDKEIGAVPLEGDLDVSPAHTTTYTLTVAGPFGVASAKATIKVLGHPETPPRGSFGEDYADLIPPDATVNHYDPKRFALINGDVLDIEDQPIEGVSISIHKHPEYGTVTTDAEGRFIIPTEGGGTLIVDYTKPGFLPVQRKIWVPWSDFATLDTVRMIQEDTISTTVHFDGSPGTVITHRSSVVTNDVGSKALTMVLQGDNAAYLIDKDEQRLSRLDTIRVRATEYPYEDTLPAKLPPTSMFTYCVELSVDGAERVFFEKPVTVWFDDFIGAPLGAAIPVGRYDRDLGAWIPELNGVLVQLLDQNGDGIVDAVDKDGDGLADDLNENESVTDEAVGLADPGIYAPGARFWRLEVQHFSAWDCNQPTRRLPHAGYYFPPNPPDIDDQLTVELDTPCSVGSYVTERSRILHEDIAIPESDIGLHYNSFLTQPVSAVIRIPVTGDTIPVDLVRNIKIDLAIAGRFERWVVPAKPNQSVEFVWDGKSRWGKLVRKTIEAQIIIEYVYQMYWCSVYPLTKYGFAQYSDGIWCKPAPNRYTRKRSRHRLMVDPPVSKAMPQTQIADGWTLSAQHYQPPLDRTTLMKGSGEKITGYTTKYKYNRIDEMNLVEIIKDISKIEEEEEEYNKEFEFERPLGLAIDPVGNLYIADKGTCQIYKWTPGGGLVTIAGNGECGEPFPNSGIVNGVEGDQSQSVYQAVATEVPLLGPVDVEVDMDGNILLLDVEDEGGDGMIRKIDSNGMLTNVFGDRRYGWRNPSGIAVDVHRNIYIADTNSHQVHKIDPVGRMVTICGSGNPGYSGDGGSVYDAQLNVPRDVAIGLQGNLYIVDAGNHAIRMVDIGGDITTIAGTGDYGFSGDNGPAEDARLASPTSIVLDPAGNLYIADQANGRVRKIDNTHTIRTIAGPGSSTCDDTGRPWDYHRLGDYWGIAVDADGNLFASFPGKGRVGKIGPLTASSVTLQSIESPIFMEDNGRGHVMTRWGRHEKTIDLNTGMTLRSFEYDREDRLIRMLDQFGKTVTIERDNAEVPTAIVSPNGHRTILTIDPDNRLSRITYPDESFYSFEYDADGMLSAKIDPNGNRFDYRYTTTGRLWDVADEEGGRTVYTRRRNLDGTILTQVASAEGNIRSYLDDNSSGYRTVTTDANGNQTELIDPVGPTASRQLANGTRLDYLYTIDQRSKRKLLQRVTETTPGGLVRETVMNKQYEDDNADGAPDRFINTISINGKQTTIEQDAVRSEISASSPEGRIVVTRYDPLTLTTESVQIPGLYPTYFEYDGQGRLVTMGTNTRTSRFHYNDEGFLDSVTSPDKQSTTFDHDAMGRVVAVHRPNGSTIGYQYDAMGNLAVLTNAAHVEHAFDYNKVNLKKIYDAPISGTYRYRYNRDRQPVAIEFPSGRSISYKYDGNQLAEVLTPSGLTEYDYRCCGQLERISRAGETVQFSYDGGLVTAQNCEGSLNQEILYTYNNDFQVEGTRYAGGGEAMVYDDDGLLTVRGAFEIDRDANNGLPESIDDGNYAEVRAHNGYGELESKQISISGLPVYEWEVARDDSGRIVQKREKTDGSIDEYAYVYDALGRLIQVARNGAIVESYAYNQRGVRIGETNHYKNISGKTFAYSDEDHLLTAGDASYAYDLDGFLSTKRDNGKVTEYDYRLTGELDAVLLPDGRRISYDYDPFGRRITKRIDGDIVEKYLWEGLTRLLAVYDGNDQRIMRFRYADARMPVAMTYQGNTYYLFYDQVGSLRMVVNENGTTVKQIEYDSFGTVINDSAPSFTVPFGFAGGLYDVDTRLLRFGHRDYDPNIGRWTAKDPIFFDRGNTDIYGYVQHDPVNYTDPLGLEAQKYSVNMFGNQSVGLLNFTASTETDLKAGTAKSGIHTSVGKIQWAGDNSGRLSSEAALYHWNTELSGGATNIYSLGGIEATAKVAAFEVKINGLAEFGTIYLKLSANGTIGSLGVEGKAGVRGIKAGLHALVGFGVGVEWGFIDELKCP